MPLTSELKLSDAFLETEEIGVDNKKQGGLSLELRVTVININNEAGAEILKKCKVLKEYSEFVSCVRKHKEQGEQNAMKQAIAECIGKGVLEEYLSRRGSEVINMLCAEYDYEMDMQVKQEEAYEEGMEAGEKIGRQEAVIELLEDIVSVSDNLKKKIYQQSDLETLKQWHRMAAKMESIEEFEKKI